LAFAVFLAKSTRQQKFEKVKSKRKSGDSSSVATKCRGINGEEISYR